MRKEWIELSKYRLEKAEAALRSAYREIEAEDYATANNRAYYSIFHAMRSVLALKGEDYKKHSGVISRFSSEYLKTELIPKEYSKLITNASLIRNRSDYEDFYICSKKDTLNLIEGADKFLDEISSFISSFEHNYDNEKD